MMQGSSLKQVDIVIPGDERAYCLSEGDRVVQAQTYPHDAFLWESFKESEWHMVADVRVSIRSIHSMKSLVLDDGSTDRTAEVVPHYSGLHCVGQDHRGDWSNAVQARSTLTRWYPEGRIDRRQGSVSRACFGLGRLHIP